MADNIEEKDIVPIGTQVDDNTLIVTSANEEIAEKWLNKMMSEYNPDVNLSTAYLNNLGGGSVIDQTAIDSYASTAQTDVNTAIAINNVIRQYINADDIIGLVVQSIANNINTEFTLSYNNFGQARNKNKTLAKAKALIDDFNNQIDIESFIHESVMTTYCEGTYITLLVNNDTNWQVLTLPLGVAEISGYKKNGQPIVLINMSNLQSALQKTMIRDKRGFMFFKDMGEEIKANYPKEVYDAYVNRYQYAKLDTAYTAVNRINNFGRKYGLSPVFRSLSPALIIREYQDADRASARAISKKVIHQVLRKEALGKDGDRKCFDLAIYAHGELVKAWKNTTVLYTSIPAVEKIEYVEPKHTDSAVSKIKEYNQRVLTSLGISFLANVSGDISSAMANISLKQLMRQINAISRGVEKMLTHFYETLLAVNNIDRIYRPTVKIIDSEMLEMDIKLELAKTLHTVFATSRHTSLGVLGISVEDEKYRREEENAADLNSVFEPYKTSYGSDLSPDDDGSGHPEGDDMNGRQEYDEEYNKTLRK